MAVLGSSDPLLCISEWCHPLEVEGFSEITMAVDALFPTVEPYTKIINFVWFGWMIAHIVGNDVLSKYY